MSWTLHGTDAENVYWRRVEDGYVIGFNKPGIGEPSSTEQAPPADIDAYVPPVESVETIEEPRLITVYAFRARFTTTEKIALETAAQGVPTATANDPRNVFAMRLRASEKDLQAARNVNLALAATREGTLALEQVGILGPGRALQILDAPIQDFERP